MVVICFLQIYIGELLRYIWVRNNSLTRLGIYLALPVASGWFVAIAVVLATAFWLGWFFVRAPQHGGDAV
jgi:hypothetical protein